MANTGFLVDWAIGRVRGRMIGVGWAGWGTGTAQRHYLSYNHNFLVFFFSRDSKFLLLIGCNPNFSVTLRWELPYFSAYKTESFPFQNNPKNLDPSYKTDLDL